MIQHQKKKPVQQWRTLCNMLTNCAKRKDLQAGRCTHHLIIGMGLDLAGLLGDHLIRCYASCGSLQEAHLVFCMIHVRSVYTWNSIISAHSNLGSSSAALGLYSSMLQAGVAPDKVTFLCIVKACTNLDDGMIMHTHVLQYGLDVNSALGSALVEFYASLGCLRDARHVFSSVRTPDVVLWGTIISAYARYSDKNALKLFEAMCTTGLSPSHFILNCTLRICTGILDVQILHNYIVKSEFEFDLILGSSLVDTYAKLGDLNAAYCVFNKVPKHDVVSWGALINAYARDNQGISALELYCQMQQGNIKPDKAIFLSILEACAQIGDIKKGRALHDTIIRNGFHMDITIGSSLVNLYAVCGGLDEAHTLFDTLLDPDVVAWGALIAGYVQHGFYNRVMELVAEMQEENKEPDEVILLSLLRACGGLGAVGLGRSIHDHILKRAIMRSLDFGNVLVNMYVECGSLKEARKVLDMLLERDEVTWGAMIEGYVQEGDTFAAFQLLEEMFDDNLKPDGVIFLCVLKACAMTGAAMKGMLIHDQVIRNGLEAEAVLLNMLVHMYASCKSFDEAHRVFMLMQKRDVVSWSALITGLALSGKCKQAEQLLIDMQHHGLKPDDTIFTIILSAYAHNGSLEEGLQFYKRLRRAYPTLAHVNCLLDAFSRSGRLREARELSQSMPFSLSMIARTALLTGSQSFGDVKLGRHCFDQVVELGSDERVLGEASNRHPQLVPGGICSSHGNPFRRGANLGVIPAAECIESTRAACHSISDDFFSCSKHVKELSANNVEGCPNLLYSPIFNELISNMACCTCNLLLMIVPNELT